MASSPAVTEDMATVDLAVVKVDLEEVAGVMAVTAGTLAILEVDMGAISAILEVAMGVTGAKLRIERVPDTIH